MPIRCMASPARRKRVPTATLITRPVESGSTQPTAPHWPTFPWRDPAGAEDLIGLPDGSAYWLDVTGLCRRRRPCTAAVV
jgi:hypothetical protein